MKFNSKKLGIALAKLSVEHPLKVKEAIPEIARFIIASGKTNKISDLSRHYKKSRNSLTNSIDVEIIAPEIDQIPEIHEIAGKKVILTKKIDPSLVGGLKIVADDFLIDNSIKSKLLKLKNLA